MLVEPQDTSTAAAVGESSAAAAGIASAIGSDLLGYPMPVPSQVTQPPLSPHHPGTSVRALKRHDVGHILASLRQSLANDWKHGLGRPIVASRGTHIHREPGARLQIGGRLFLGDNHVNPGHDTFARSSTTLVLGRDSLFDVRGFATIGPGVNITLSPGAHFTIDHDSYISADASVFCTCSITIGRGCALAWGLLVMDSDFHQAILPGRTPLDHAPIVIHDNVWVGARVTILKGVEIGEGAIVGAGAVVTRSVPARTLVAGNPARVIREDVDWIP